MRSWSWRQIVPTVFFSVSPVLILSKIRITYYGFVKFWFFREQHKEVELIKVEIRILQFKIRNNYV